MIAVQARIPIWGRTLLFSFWESQYCRVSRIPWGCGEIAQQLMALLLLQDDLIWFPAPTSLITTWLTTFCNSKFQGDLMSSLASTNTFTLTVHIHNKGKALHSHKIKEHVYIFRKEENVEEGVWLRASAPFQTYYYQPSSYARQVWFNRAWRLAFALGQITQKASSSHDAGTGIPN